jgi:hypothetical protein
MQIIMLFLFCAAFVLAFAAYKSVGIGGDEVLNASRLVKAGAWLLATVWTIDSVMSGRRLHSPMAIVAAMLAFSEVVTGLLRFKKLLRHELAAKKRDYPVLTTRH